MHQDNRIWQRPGASEFGSVVHRNRAEEGNIRVHLDLTAPVPVVQITGRLDRAAIRPCREALDLARQARENIVVLDLARATSSARDTIPLLGAMRRFLAAGGVALTLVRVPPELESAMRGLGVWDLYSVVPN